MIVSCSLLKRETVLGGKAPKYSVEMNLEDKAGSFFVQRESGLSSDKKYLVSKYRVFPSDSNKQKALEQSILLSRPGVLGKSQRVLRPEKSEYRVWFEAKLYQTETSIDVQGRNLVIEMKSPESQWNGVRKFPFPGGTGVFCYFSQLVECAKFTGFIDKAITEKNGKMSFHIIWDGYPYIQEQYDNLNNEPFSSAVLEYDGQTNEGDHRFSLNTSNNIIFYLFNDSYEYAKMFWPSQGFSLYHR